MFSNSYESYTLDNLPKLNQIYFPSTLRFEEDARTGKEVKIYGFIDAIDFFDPDTVTDKLGKIGTAISHWDASVEQEFIFVTASKAYGETRKTSDANDAVVVICHGFLLPWNEETKFEAIARRWFLPLELSDAELKKYVSEFSKYLTNRQKLIKEKEIKQKQELFLANNIKFFTSQGFSDDEAKTLAEEMLEKALASKTK